MDWINWMMILKAFIIGGLFCVVGQILIDKTKLTPSKILVIYVTTGVVFGALGIYQKLIEFAGAGASVPLTGFGNLLGKGAVEGVKESGILGAFTGGIRLTAAGISSALFFGFLVSLIAKPKMKKE